MKLSLDVAAFGHVFLFGKLVTSEGASGCVWFRRPHCVSGVFGDGFSCDKTEKNGRYNP